MSRPTPQERLAILDRRKNVARRYLRGEQQWEIARAFEVTQQTISLDLKAIQAEWLAQAVLDRGEWTARELAKIDHVETAAWGAWSKSLENAEVLKARMRRHGEHAEEATEKTSKGQAGDPRFLDLVLKCVARRCELLALNATSGFQSKDENSRIVERVIIYVPDDGRNPSSDAAGTIPA